MIITPLIVSDLSCSIFGILRAYEKEDRIVILFPAEHGTRNGPNRIFVDIAAKLLENRISSFAFELPQSGDSFDNSEIPSDLNLKYRKYLDLVTSYLRVNFQFSSFILLSISLGCVPAFDYSKLNYFNQLILLSPIQIIEKKPIKFHVYFRIRKLKGLMVNLFTHAIKETNTSNKINILAIFAQNDIDLSKYRLYWNLLRRQNKFISFTEIIIKDADHSFSGWIFKQEVCQEVVKWINLSPYK